MPNAVIGSRNFVLALPIDFQIALTNLEIKIKEEIAAPKSAFKIVALGAFTFLILIVFLVSIEMIGISCRLLGSEIINSIITATANPFIGLFIGLLLTAIIQSSSVSTSILVAVVASGTLTLESAIPIVMGANIGTTITSTIVSLGYITRKKEFRKAISAATVHDFFNILATIILFPLEYFTHFLSSLSHSLAESINKGRSGIDVLFHLSPIEGGIRPLANLLINIWNSQPYITIAVAVLLLGLSLKGFTSIFQTILIGDSQKNLEKFLFSSPIKSLSWGIGITAAIQSSSVTTSLMVPLVAKDKTSLRNAFHFIMGANIGTTVTALIAAFSKTAEPAMAIAVAHFLFNVFGVLIIFGIPKVEEVPLFFARTLGSATLKNRLVGFAYIVIVFFLLPFLLIYLNK